MLSLTACSVQVKTGKGENEPPGTLYLFNLNPPDHRIFVYEQLTRVQPVVPLVFRHRAPHHHQPIPPLGIAVGRFDQEVDQQAFTILHQRVARVVKLGLFALAFARQQRVRIGGRPSVGT
jgi:hypothetical protein